MQAKSRGRFFSLEPTVWASLMLLPLVARRYPRYLL